MATENKKILHTKTVYGIIIYAAVFLAFALISYYTELETFLNRILGIFGPVLVGLVVAYLANPFFRFFERKVWYRLRPAPLRRGASLLCTYVFMIAIVAAILWLVLSQLIPSATSFLETYELENTVHYINDVFHKINELLSPLFGGTTLLKPIDGEQLQRAILSAITTLFQIDPSQSTNFADIFEAILGTIRMGASFFGIVTDGILAFFVSLYLLATKEKRYEQIMKLRRALFNDQINRRITHICTIADDSLGKFFEGKLISAIIVGVLTYVIILIVGVPHASIIATITALCSIVPIVGLLASLIPSGLLILLTDAERIIPFLIVMFIIYLIDANIISPKILGNNTGISTLCVIIAICIFGTLWGFTGMILGVPLFATILELSDTFIHRRLQQKRMPSDVENYYSPDPGVSPQRATVSGYGRMIRRLEQRVLHARMMRDSGDADEMTRGDRFALWIHSIGIRIRLFKEIPPNAITQHACEEMTRRIARESARNREYLAEYVYFPSDSTEPTDGKGA